MEPSVLDKIGAKEDENILDIKLSLATNEKATTDEILAQISAIRESHEKGQTDQYADF